MENKITGKDSVAPAAPVPDENSIPPVFIEEAPKPKLFSFESLEKVKGVIAQIQGVAEKIQKTLGQLDETGTLKVKPDIEKARDEIAASTSQYLQSHPETQSPAANGAIKQKTLEFLQSETKFSLLPYSQQLSLLKGEPLRWSDAEVKSGLKPKAGGWKENRLRFALALKLEAKALEEAGKLEDAAQFFHSASMFAPQDIGLHADAARLLKAQSQKNPDPILKKQQAESAEKHLEAVADEMQVGRLDTLIGKGKLAEAEILAARIKADFFIRLSPEQRKVLEASPKIRERLLEASVFEADIAEKQGKHDRAIDIYQRFLKHCDKLIAEHPAHAEAYLLRAKIHHGLGDYGGALSDYQALAKLSSQDAGYLESYRQDLGSLAKNLSAEWRLAEAMGDSGKATLFLTEEIKVQQALGATQEWKTLSAKLAALSKEMSFDKLMVKAQELAAGAYLSPASPALQGYSSYLKFSPKEGGGYQLSFTEAFSKLGDRSKLEVLQKLHMEGFLGLNRALAAKESDPAKKNFYQGKVLLLEGNLPGARLKLALFKQQSQDSQDPEVLKMCAEARSVLRELNLAALKKLGEWQGALSVQRHASLVSVAATVNDDNLSSGFLKESPRLISALKYYLENGKADTIDEALAAIQADSEGAMDDFAKNPTVKTGMKITYTRWVAAGKAGKEVTIAGGTLDMGHAAASGTQYPDVLKVVIGPEGGCIKTDTYAYVFPPGKGKKELVISGGKLKPGALKELIYDPTRLSNEEDKKKDFLRTSYKHEPEFLWANAAEFHPGDPETLRLIAEHGRQLATRDHDFHALFRLETQAGLQEGELPEKRRSSLLAAAKEIRHRTGSYVVAAEILEGLFAKDFSVAMQEISDAKIQAAKKEVEADRPKVTKQVKAELDKLKEKQPAEFKKRFPKGEASEDEIRSMVDQSLAGKLSVKLRKMAFEKIDAKAEQGALSDGVATEAWKIYDDMKDPTDKTWNLADESWDGIVDEVVITAVTMPVTMGVGAAVRGGIGGSSLALRWVAQGGGRALAMKAGILLGAAVAEGFTMEAFNQGDFEWKGVGWNTLMSVAFHGGGKAWGKAAEKLGLDDAALALLRQEGKSVGGKSAANFAGTMLTQSTVATTMGYAGDLILNHDNPNTFWERFGGEALRMLAFHYGTHAINLSTGHLIAEADLATQSKLKVARESYLKWVEQGIPKEEAAKRAVAYAKDLKIDAKSGEISYDLKPEDVQVLETKAETPKPSGFSTTVEAQVQKAKKLAAIGVERELVDKKSAERLSRELESYLRQFMAAAEMTLDAQKPGIDQQKKLIPELAKKNAEHFTRRFAEELGLKKEGNFQKRLEGLLRESLEIVAARHNERLPAFPLEPSAGKPASPKMKRADKAAIAAGVETLAHGLQAATEQWVAAQEKGDASASREVFLRQQSETAFRCAEELGLSGDPVFRKGLAEMVVGFLRRAEVHASSNAWLPDAMAAYAKKAPAEKISAKPEAPIPNEKSAAKPKQASLDIDQVVVEVNLLAKEFSGDTGTFKKELARVLITSFHELRDWVAKDSPGALETGERIQFVSEALAKKMGERFGFGKDPAFVKKVEGLLRTQLKENLSPKKVGSDTEIRPPDFSESKAPLTVESLFPEPTPSESQVSHGEFLAAMDQKISAFLESARSSLESAQAKKTAETSLFSGVFGDSISSQTPPEVARRNLKKMKGGLQKRLLDFVYDKVQKAEGLGPEGLKPADKVKLAEEVIRFAEEFGLAQDSAFTEPLKRLVWDGMTESSKGFSNTPAVTVPKPGPVGKQVAKLRRSFLDKIFEARGELAVPEGGKINNPKDRHYTLDPVLRASLKLDAIFSMIEGRMMEHPSPELAKVAEAIGRDIDALVKEDPAKLGARFDAEVGAEKSAALGRLERLLRGFELNPNWCGDSLILDYGKPFTGKTELHQVYAQSLKQAYGEPYGKLLSDALQRLEAKQAPFYQLAQITLEEVSRRAMGSEEIRDFLDRYAVVRDMELEKSEAKVTPVLPGFFEDMPMAAHVSPLGKTGHSEPDTWAPKTLETPPPESTWSPAPSAASFEASLGGDAKTARKAEIAKAWIEAFENTKSPVHGDPEYQASYAEAKAYLGALAKGDTPPETHFVSDYHVTVKSEQSLGVLIFAEPGRPPEKTWEVVGKDPKGRLRLKNLKDGATRDFQTAFEDKPAFLPGDRVAFLPAVSGASDGPLRRLSPAEGHALWIGRDPSQANVVVFEDCVSRLHCSIERAPQGWYVADRNSSNGVYLNGQKVEKSAWLKPGDVLSTKDKQGQFHLLGVFEPPLAAPSASPKSPPDFFSEASPILQGNVDLASPPVLRLKPSSTLGEVAAVTTQGEGYGKNNEDSVLVMRGKEGLLLLDVDGMGGEGHGDIAAKLTSEAFKAEMERSGDEKSAWALANSAIRTFNGELTRLTGGGVKWAKPEQVQKALAAARARIANPGGAFVPEAKGSGAVAVAVQIHPGKKPGEAHRAEFSWVGDARAMILERGPDGNWHWVFRTVDEGLPSVPGMLRPGEDYDFGGARKTLAGAIHPSANIVTNSLGSSESVALKKTHEGEFPAPGTATGSKEAGKDYEHGVALRPGQLILAGSDGFWENFGSTREILDLIKHCKTAEDAREVLTKETHRRMKILGEARRWLDDPASNPKHLDRYPIELQGKTLYLDRKGRVFDTPQGGKAVNHFKTDNFSLITYLHEPFDAAAESPQNFSAAAYAKPGPRHAKMMGAMPGLIPGLQYFEGRWTFFMPKSAGEVVLGRDAFPSSLETSGVSARHVRLFRSAGGVFIQDLGSLNGMRVIRDGKEVFAWKSLDRKPGPSFAVHPGDQIMLEGTSVYFFGSE